MPRIFDNIDLDLLPSLRQTLNVSERSDFCFGYFNLRGWKSIDDLIDQWSGQSDHQCRLLVGLPQRRSDTNDRKAISDVRIFLKTYVMTLDDDPFREFEDGWGIKFTVNDNIGRRQVKTIEDDEIADRTERTRHSAIKTILIRSKWPDSQSGTHKSLTPLNHTHSKG